MGHGIWGVASAPKELKKEYEADYRKKGGHPCIAYADARYKRYDAERVARLQDHFENSGSCYYCKTAGASLGDCSWCGQLFCLFHRNPERHHCPPYLESVKKKEAEDEKRYAKIRAENEKKEREKRKKKWLVVLSFIVILCVAFYLFVMPVIAQQYKPCMDNTTGQTCSNNTPYFCAAGQLVYSPERCGCPEGYMAEAGVCQKILYCTDGTVYGSCSGNKPFFCANGSLIENVSGCGCPYGASIRQQGDKCIDLNQPGIPSFEKSIHDQINQQRTENGLPALTLDARLSDIARSHSEDMANRGYFEHVTPEGVDPTGRGEAVGYICSKSTTYGIAENIFQTQTYDKIWYTNGVETSRDYLTPDALTQQIVIGWMNSPGHRQNILTGTYDREGIGVYVTANGMVYVTEDFC